MPRFSPQFETNPIDIEMLHAQTLTVRRLGGLGDIIMCAIAANTLSKELKLPVHFVSFPQYHKFLLHFKSIKSCSSKSHKLRDPTSIFFNLQELADVGLDCLVKPRWEIFAEGLQVSFLPDEAEISPFPKYPTKLSPYIGLALRASTPDRTWPHMLRLAARLAEGFPVALFDSKRRSFPKNVINLSGLTLCKVVSALQFCRLLISSDTGLLQLAMLLRIPAIGIFGNIAPRLRIWRPELVTTIHHDNIPCCPCHEFKLHDCHYTKDYLKCLTSVSVDEVLSQVHDLQPTFSHKNSEII
jgi:hypothetical protein